MDKRIVLQWALRLSGMVACLQASGQDISDLKGKRPFDLSGTLSLNTATFASNRPGAFSAPFSWTISGNPTVMLWGIAFPFTIVYSERDRSFRQPFNRIGVSPRWKWLTLHAGYRNISFSKYTLGGWQFLGGGFETNSKLRLGAVYGRFMRPVDISGLDSLERRFAVPAFDRRGYAFKLGYGTAQNHWDFLFFSAKDDTLSIASEDSRRAVQPQENMAFGVRGNFTFAKVLVFDLDAGASALTHNLYADSIPLGVDYPRWLERYFRPNVTTRLRYAGDAGLALRLRKFNIRLSYALVQQDFATLGAYNFNTDVERWLFSPGFSFWKGKVQVQTSIGLQRNNTLNNRRDVSGTRNIGFNVSARPGPRFSANLNYYNFQNSLQRSPDYPVDLVDSLLNFRQASQSASGGATYQFGPKERTHTLSLHVSGNSYDDGSPESAGTGSFTISPSLNWRMHRRALGLVVGVNAAGSLIQNPNGNITRWTGGVLCTKKMLKDRLSANVNAGFSQTTFETLSGGGGLGWYVRAGAGLRVQKTHTLSMNLNLTDAPRSAGSRVQTFSGSLTYSYALSSLFRQPEPVRPGTPPLTQPIKN